jgi:type IV pilus assembly protein PilY1
MRRCHVALLAVSAILATHATAVNAGIDIAAICKTSAGGIGERAASGNVAVSATTMSSSGVYVYQPGLDSSRWSGNLKRFRLTPDNAGVVTVAREADWDAGEILTGTDAHEAHPLPDARRIYTSKIRPDHALATIEFKWDNLSREQQRQLDTSPVSGKRDGYGSRRLAYLRGARALEKGKPGGVFRMRDRVLGDIVSSTPMYVGAPSPAVRGGGYGDFYDNHRNRTKAVYVGANDGMLHAFDADGGGELFAYLPSALIPNLNSLTSPDYAHRPFVDGGLTVAEAKMSGQWQTVLAASVGGGARGVFALDVTNPGDFSGGRGALWEFTDADDADMGNLIGAPVIAKFRTKTAKGVAQYRYFVVVSSGMSHNGGDSPGALFLLSLDKHATERWHEGANYYKFRVPATETGLANGLSTPALAIDGEGAVKYAYAGDLQGNLWRFDFSGDAPWTHAIAISPDPLFVARDANNVRQPITVQPRVMFAPGGGYVVLFGTGRFLESADALPGNFRPQSFYAILDAEGVPVTGRDQLAARTAVKSMDGDTVEVSGADFIYGARGNARKGWYFDLPDAAKTGERNVSGPVLAYGRVFVNTLIPDAGSCATWRGRTFALDALSGLPARGASTGMPSAVGLPGSPVLFDMGNAESGDRHALGSRTVARKYSVLNFGTAAIDLPAGRFGRHEIVNWQEVRRTAGKK